MLNVAVTLSPIINCAFKKSLPANLPGGFFLKINYMLLLYNFGNNLLAACADLNKIKSGAESLAIDVCFVDA